MDLAQTSPGRPAVSTFAVYAAADAIPIARNPMPNPQEGMIVRGAKSRIARLMKAEIELPEQPKSPSFFTVIGQDSAREDTG